MLSQSFFKLMEEEGEKTLAHLTGYSLPAMPLVYGSQMEMKFYYIPSETLKSFPMACRENLQRSWQDLSS